MQLSLTGDGAPRFDSRFSRAHRVEFGEGAWMEHVPQWIEGHDTLFRELRECASWRADRRRMYDRIVDVPRLRARFPQGGPRVVEEMSDALSRRYRAPLHAITLALYRDGRDSVAWHRDRDHRDRESSVVAVVTLGGARTFMVRPQQARAEHGRAKLWSVTVAGGDVLVMGGSSQRTVEHCVPKCRSADPRIAIMFRHDEPISPLVSEAEPLSDEVGRSSSGLGRDETHRAR